MLCVPRSGFEPAQVPGSDRSMGRASVGPSSAMSPLWATPRCGMVSDMVATCKNTRSDTHSDHDQDSLGAGRPMMFARCSLGVPGTGRHAVTCGDTKIGLDMYRAV